MITQVTPASAAADAGIQSGDYLLRIGEVEASERSFGQAFRVRYSREAAGTPLDVEVRRGEETLSLSMELRFVESTAYTLVEDPDAGEKAIRIRESILEGTVDR